MLGVIFAVLGCLSTHVHGQVYTPEPVHYEGRYNGETVELLVEFIQDVPLVLLYWPQREEVYCLRAQDRAVLFKEHELFTNRPTGRLWQLEITDRQVSISRPNSSSATLTVQATIPTPSRIAAIRRAESASPSAFFELCRLFTGIRYDILSYGQSAVADAIQFNADDLTFLQRPVNLFGTDAPELVVEVQISFSVHVVRVFRKQGSSWQLLPSALFFKRSNRDDEPCLTEPPGPGYFFYDFVEVLRPNEFIVYGYTYDGHCSDIYRGDDIFFYTWQVLPSGFRELFRAPARQYWYASPDPAPIAPPVYQEFEFGSPPGGRSFPRQLFKREGLFSWPQGVQPGEMMQPTGYRTEYISLF